MTGAGHYKVTVGGDPEKAGQTVDQVAKKTTFFGSIFGKRTSMDDFLNVRGPKLGDAGRMVLSAKEAASVAPPRFGAPPAPSSPSVQRPMLFGRNPSALSSQVAKVGSANVGDVEEDEDEYSDDDEFEDEEEDEALLAPEKDQREDAPKPNFRELDSDKQQALVQEAFAYIESISGGNRRKKSGSSNRGGKKVSKKRGGGGAGKKKPTRGNPKSRPFGRPGAKKRANRPANTKSSRQQNPMARRRNSRNSSNADAPSSSAGGASAALASGPRRQQENDVGQEMLPQWKEKPIHSSVLGDTSNRRQGPRGVDGKKMLSPDEIERLTKNLEEGLEIERLRTELSVKEDEASVKNTYDFIANIKNELNMS
jgi:hypothetical protein